ncbi:hypothetical protein EJ05DRAFT_9412 [Pseudovirgaria hyperparasitica]|uniref:Uncharacterized protein n=1 Tax=Pseudovirgaria hyperparasitica TaxID=470096 RepID=A0A6A6WL04_9PEZI|nr:uncharacterized protein EJ05DRAFT_9412 [Pseudovirgaria hyperparasitica]KAF2762689.1 hypothetical protein EJ05DRAFT_9412 [Pseudovirgaria hyperparasitica]
MACMYACMLVGIPSIHPLITTVLTPSNTVHLPTLSLSLSNTPTLRNLSQTAPISLSRPLSHNPVPHYTKNPAQKPHSLTHSLLACSLVLLQSCSLAVLQSRTSVHPHSPPKSSS